MKYQESVYKDFSSFLAVATEISKDKINLYNSLIDPPTRKKIQGNAFQKFLKFLIFVIKKAGWYIYIAIGGLLGLGFFGYFGGMGALMASNPPLAVAVAILGGGGIYLLWKNKDVYLAHEKIGKRYKKDFENILENYPSLKEPKNRIPPKRIPQINNLLKRCVKSICVEVFSISSDEFVNKVSDDL